MLLLLFRIMFACLSDLPIESLNVPDITSAVVPYFNHLNKDIQIAAMNAGQFLIPFSKGSKSTRQLFVLSENHAHTLLCTFGKSMPVSSSLKLLHSFSALPENFSLFKSKGFALLSTSIVVLSPQQIEKELAFFLLKDLLLCTKSSTEDDVFVGSPQEMCTESKMAVNVQKEYGVEDTFQELNRKLKRILLNIDDGFPLLQEQYTEIKNLLMFTLPNHRHEIEVTTSLLLQCVRSIAKSKLAHLDFMYVYCSLS